MTSPDWAAGLADLERWTAEQARRLADGDHAGLASVAVAPPPRPTGLPPAAVLPRARQALADLERLTEQLAEARGATRRELQLQRRVGEDRPSSPRYVDGYG